MKDSYTILYFAEWDLLGSAFSPSVLSKTFSTNLCPVYYSTSVSAFSFWEAMMVHRAIIFFSFALLNLSPFSSSPLVGGKCSKVSEMRENFIWNMNFTFMLLLSEISKWNRQACEVNFIGKNVWFIQISSLLLFSLKHEALLDNFKPNYFLDKGEIIEVRFYKQIDGSLYKVFKA